MDKELLAKLSAVALNSIFGYEPKFSHRIIDALGSAEAVFALSEDEKRNVFGPYSKYLPLISGDSLEKARTQYEHLTAEGYQIISLYDDEYPSLLRECEDAPMVLYVRSDTPAKDIFNKAPCISVVGTRDISLYGKEWCRRIVGASALAPSRPDIVSGFAIGVDITAHLAALDEGLGTIAVLPVGIDDVYPRRHSLVAQRLAGTPGCALVTDYPPGTCATAFNFLRRNRIIAGMSQATILIESKIKGGGMMTARLASDYGREVFALPGRIDDIRSAGCNLLLREKVAEPVTSLDGLGEALGLGTFGRRKTADILTGIERRYRGTVPDSDVETMRTMAALIKKERGITIDGICASLDAGYGDVARLVVIMENDGIISTDLLQRCSINPKNY